ncbi:acetyl-CoA acetyltransferase [Parafrankia sp. EAN1pec]|uniref:thiolase family protein n=1 Tax=Parafrankia sp. (strain EAN1pec) TaxID=298653 RepID=UPI00005407CE|nr:acetyl-CoA acetyltransferase [Frankia sp. EAN1pec]
MRDAVIVEAVRSPLGKRNGGLSAVAPVDLGASLLQALVARTGLDPAVVDDVVWGCVTQVAEQSVNIGRNTVLAAGWPETVPGTTVDRQCGSSQQAVHFAAASVIAGYYDVVVAGGVESMSRVPMGSQTIGAWPFGDGFRTRYPDIEPNQGIAAEMIAEKYGFSREALDEFSLRSHELAAAAQDNDAFAAEIVPVDAAPGVVADEGIRRGGDVTTLGKLSTPFKPDGVISAGNSSQISDGASALLITSSEKAAELGLRPIVRIHSAVVVGDDPVMMLTGPIPATARILRRSGLSLGDIGTFEVNEAFASIPLAWLAETGADPARLNPRGGAIALGHPLGGSGGRLMSTMINHMRDNGIRYGLQTMCEGGGLANATILELL